MSMLDQRPSTDRAHVYRALAGVFRTPHPGRLEKLRSRDLPALCEAVGRLGAESDLLEVTDDLARLMDETNVEELEQSYHDTFEPTGGLRCAPHETSHAADSPQEALVRTFQLADIAGFYRAFGVEVTPETERVDHISVELEFMHLLALKEALAEAQENLEGVAICRDAARSFLREHLVGAQFAGFIPYDDDLRAAELGGRPAAGASQSAGAAVAEVVGVLEVKHLERKESA